MIESTDKIKTLIVDDEPHARATLRLLLQTEPEIEIVGECKDGFAAIKAIRKTKPDLIFLDAQMPEMNGFEMLNKLNPDEYPCVVFVTAYDQYALKAFEVNALDYLLKPFDDDRFGNALQRAKSQIKQNEVNNIGGRLKIMLENYESDQGFPKYLNRLSIKSGGRIFFISVLEIDWIEAADQYVQLHVGNKIHLLRESMNKLEKHLDPEKFCRIHRSTIVNIENIKELESSSTGDYNVILKDKTQLKLSRNRREALQKRIGWSF